MKPSIRILAILLAALLQIFSETAGATQKNAPKTAAPARLRNSCAPIYLNGTAPNLRNRNMAVKSRELCLDHAAIMYSGISHTPLWAAEHLTREMVAQAEHPVLTDDIKNERGPVAAGNPEYKFNDNSPYEIGYMAPPEDMPTVRAQRQCYTLANLIPVSRVSNAGIWKPVESAVREYVKNDGELYVVTGALFINGSSRFLKERFLVPSHLYKVVFDPLKNRGAAYLIRNEPGTVLQVVGIGQIEKMAGIEFFPGLPDASKQELLKLPKPKIRN